MSEDTSNVGINVIDEYDTEDELLFGASYHPEDNIFYWYDNGADSIGSGNKVELSRAYTAWAGRANVDGARKHIADAIRAALKQAG